MPFEHIHLHQDEIFHVRKGEIRLKMNGKEMNARAGETVTVPAGAAHIAFNNKDEMLECIVEYRPGFDHHRLMQCLYGLTNDGFIDKKGSISIPKMGYFLARMKTKCLTRPTSIPAPMLKTAMFFFYACGSLFFWMEETLHKIHR